MVTAFLYWQQNHAFTEDDYAFTGVDGACKKEGDHQFGQPTQWHVGDDYYVVRANDVEQMKASVYRTPLSVAIEADTKVF